MIQIVKVFNCNQSDEITVLHESDTIAENERLAHIVRYEHHRLAQTLLKPTELFLDFGSRDGIQRAERFVEQKNRRICRKRTRYAHALPLSAGELARQTPGKAGRFETHKRKQVVHSRIYFVRRPGFERWNQPDVSMHSEVRK